MLENNPRYLKKNLVAAETVEPGEVIQVFPRAVTDRYSFRAMVVEKIVIEYGRGSERNFVPVYKQVHLIVKPDQGKKNLGIGLGTAVQLRESLEVSLVETVRMKGNTRITKTRVCNISI